MKFHPTPLDGSFLVELEPHRDVRGFFARTFCQREFLAHGLETQFAQANISRSVSKGTLRGMHYQLEPAAEVKLVRCVAGALYDVIIDMRSDTDTFLKWFGQELTPENLLQMYVPRGFAHGFLSLRDDTEIQYLVSDFNTPGLERGIRYDDPAVGIVWPDRPAQISAKDGAWPDYDPDFHGLFRKAVGA